MATREQLIEALRRADEAGNFEDAQAIADLIKQQQENTPSSVSLGQNLRQLPRQLGLTARAGVSGVLDIADLLATPFRAGLEAVTGKQIAPAADVVPDMIGLPQPATANERTAQAGARAVAGAATPIGLARLASPSGPVGQSIKSMLTTTPSLQLSSAGGAGVAQQSVAEAGGGGIEQAAGGLLGAVAAPVALSKTMTALPKVAGAIDSFRPAAQQAQTTNIDIQINSALQPTGITLKDLPAVAQKQLREETQRALNTGGKMSQQAIQRFADYALTRATPTRGTVTLDPTIVTQQKNAAKRGANSTDPAAQRLSRIENENNAILLNQLNEMGAAKASDNYTVGNQMVEGIGQVIDANKNRISKLYSNARDASGRAAELEPFTFTKQANDALDRNLKTKFLPAEIKSIMNDIAEGKLPLTVDVAEQLKTTLATAQRGATDGNVRAAVGFVRDALENTPLRAGQGIGQEAIDAFNQARAANRNFMANLEKNPALKAVNDGIEPDKFFDKFVLRSPVREFSEAIKLVPNQREQIRNQVLQFIKDKATGGRSEDVAVISGLQMKKALDQIGTKKLEMLFSPEEIKMLRSIGKVADYERFQPVGSAVNNSNTAAALSSMVERLASSSLLGKLPLGMLVQEPAQNIFLGRQANQALNATSGLSLPAPKMPRSLLSPTVPMTINQD